MYTKKLLSVAASVAVMSTGAIAFDASHNPVMGTIQTNSASGATTISSYTDGNTSDTNITIATGTQGDALIYPAFNQKDSWGTEIVVRNNSNKAIVAKAVLYAADDSRELKDFNIYLSPYDVSRFTIEGGKIKSADDSIRTYGIYPHQAINDANRTEELVDMQNSDIDKSDYAAISFADNADKPFDEDMTVEAGYVAIYGMEEVLTHQYRKNPDANASKGSWTTDSKNFHGDHAGLYAAYAASLDESRDGWRNLTSSSNGNMLNGMFKSGVTQAPNIDGNNSAGGAISFKWAETDADIIENNTTFGPVSAVLSGTVRIYNPEGRDMLLNATALDQFTDNRRVLWTEGEYASLADRCIGKADANNAYGDDNSTATTSNKAVYVGTCVENDAEQFVKANAVYNFSNAKGDVQENKLLVTQVYKRILAQLNYYSVGATDTLTTSSLEAGKSIMEHFGYNGLANYTEVAATGTGSSQTKTVDTGVGYKFNVSYETFDEKENKNAEEIGGTIIVSPRSSSDNTVTFNNELQEVNPDQLEKNPDLKGAYDNINGFSVFKLGVPAITTQMVGSVVGSSAETNWVYTESINGYTFGN